MALGALAAAAWAADGGSAGAAQPAEEASKVIVFADGFETGDLSRWDELRYQDQIRVTDDPAGVHSGRYALEVPFAEGKNGGEAIKWFLPGREEVYVRWYIKFEAGFDMGNGMHQMILMGNRPDNRWSGFGTAGTKPDGTNFWVANVDPVTFWEKYPNPGAFCFYSYWPDMKLDTKTGKYWGNYFWQEEPASLITAGRWHELIVHLKMNASGKSDGLEELTIDGERKIRVEGLRWRTDPTLTINTLWVCSWTKAAKAQKMWIDDITISTEPLTPAKPGPPEAPATGG
jgi:hypothetical protein